MKKTKSFFIVLIFLSSVFSAIGNFNLYALNSINDGDEFMIDNFIFSSNQDFNWSQIEVISELYIGQNWNVNESKNPKIAVENDKIYVVWEDTTNITSNGIDFEIFYRYFDGNTWSDIQVISEPMPPLDKNIAPSIHPDIAVENGKIYVVWQDQQPENGAGTDPDIFYRCNLTGTSWEDIQILSEPVLGQDFNFDSSLEPKIAVENSKIYVVWYDDNKTYNAGPDFDIFYRCNLTGNGWEDIQVISEPVQGPDIAIENSKIYVVWTDANNTNGAGSDADIFYRYNTTGLYWETIQVISEPLIDSNTNTGNSDYSSIAVEDGNIHVVWGDQNNTKASGTDWDIFYRCNPTGSNWEEIQVISEPILLQNYNIQDSTHPVIAVNNSKIYITWWDKTDLNGAGTDDDIFYRINIAGINWENIQVLSEPIAGNNFNTGISSMPHIAHNNDKSYIVWQDKNNTNDAGTDWDIFYRWIEGSLSPLFLELPNVFPLSGNTSTNFNFTVTYTNIYNKGPTTISINTNSMNYPLLETDPDDLNYIDGKKYYFNKTNLDIGMHNYQFLAFDGSHLNATDIIDGPQVYNMPPKIITKENITAYEDYYYESIYEFEDIDAINIGQPLSWGFYTNASWLSFEASTATLYGTPTNDEVGEYWVNISINDTIDIDFINFTLKVVNINDNPIINTTNIEVTNEDEEYIVDYNATDIDSPIENQRWSLETNAKSWLNIDVNTGLLQGIPTNENVGTYWVNINVSDMDSGFDFTIFSLTVKNVNDPPKIITDDVLEADVNMLYEVDYNATDVDSSLPLLEWSLYTNASNWLSIHDVMGVLSGTPSINCVGCWYIVNVTVNDGDGGQDWHEFKLKVIKVNKAPQIITQNVKSAIVNITYTVDYEATDDRTPSESLQWTLETNATWLSMDSNTGILNGTPSLKDIGSYWIRISVFDGENGWDYHEFTLRVEKEPVLPPELINPRMTPTKGDTETEFTFSVIYSQPDNIEPESIKVVIDGTGYDLSSSNGRYEYVTNLTEGVHTYYFTTTLREHIVYTNEVTTNYIDKARDEPEDRKDNDEDNTMLYAGIGIIALIIIIIIIILLFIFLKRKKQKEEPVKEEETSAAPLTPPVGPQSKLPSEQIPLSQQVIVPTVSRPTTVKKPAIQDEMEE